MGWCVVTCAYVTLILSYDHQGWGHNNHIVPGKYQLLDQLVAFLFRSLKDHTTVSVCTEYIWSSSTYSVEQSWLHLSASTTNRQGFRGAYPLQELSNPDAGASLIFRLLKILQQNVCPTSLRFFTSQSGEKLLFMQDGELRRLHY